MPILSLAPYVIVGSVYIWAAWNHQSRPQTILKPFLVPLLLLFRLTTSGWDGLVCPGLILGWIGDVCLMGRGQRWFVAGLSAFLLGHVFYVAYAISALFPDLSPAALLWCLPVMAFSVRVLLRLWKKLGPMRIPACAYCLLLSLMAISGGVWFLCRPSLPSGLFALGGILFALSDAQLAIGLFDRPAARQDFLVMTSYILAQGLLTIASCLR